MQLVLIIILFCVYSLSYASTLLEINQESALRIGIKIWYNECNGKIDGLTTWNEGEQFASLGIGHFIWHPLDKNYPSKDGFSLLIKYMEQQGVMVPTWLQGEKTPPCPWRTRKEFLAAKNSAKMQELRQFLVATIPVQAQFMAHRLVCALPKLLSTAPTEERDYIFQQFASLAYMPQGLYALVDYVNFKGEGTGWFANNNHSGWGLLQVVEGMKTAPENLTPLQAFVWSADHALTERVRQAPATSHESKWLLGWRKRIYSYLKYST